MPEKDDASILSAFSIERFVAGIRSYFKILLSFVRHPIETGRTADLSNIRKAFSVYVTGVLLAYIMYVPLMLHYDIRFKKTEFLIGVLLQFCLIAVVLHSAAKLANGHGSWRATVGTYMYFIGLTIPLVVLLYYPVLMYAPINDIILENIGSEALNSKIVKAPTYIQYYYYFCIFPFLLLLIFSVFYRWLAFSHSIKYWRLLLGMLIIYVPFSLFCFNKVLPVVKICSDYIGKFVDKL